MYTDLKGKIAVVTGSSSGIGAAIARRFIKEGMKVVINYYSDQEEAEKIVEELKLNGGEAIAVYGDVKKEKDIGNLLSAALYSFGDLDAWVNNAGMQSAFQSHKMPLKEWESVINTNLTGTFLGCREALNYFVKKNKKGSLINISSIHETVPFLSYAHYSASKGGIKQLTKTLALEYGEKGIRVNAIAPGAIRTSINGSGLPDPEKEVDDETSIPLRYIGEPDEIANVAAWLVSCESSYVTGTTIYADGGLSMSKTQTKEK